MGGASLGVLCRPRGASIWSRRRVLADCYAICIRFIYSDVLAGSGRAWVSSRMGAVQLDV